MRVLDVATGAGEPAISIALKVGASGMVVATDLVAAMLAGARRRAAALDLAQLRFVVADMAALPYPAATFDAMTCRFGLMFAPDPVAAAAEVRRVLRRGARAAWMVWGPPEYNTVSLTVRRTLAEFFGDTGPDTGAARYRFAAAGLLERTLRAAGFADVAEVPFDETVEIAAGRPFWQTQLVRNGGARVAALDAAGRAALDRAVAAAFEPHRAGDALRLRSFVRLCAGVAP
jgi:SAM-dependent methyltransferase